MGQIGKNVPKLPLKEKTPTHIAKEDYLRKFVNLNKNQLVNSRLGHEGVATPNGSCAGALRSPSAANGARSTGAVLGAAVDVGRAVAATGGRAARVARVRGGRDGD